MPYEETQPKPIHPVLLRNCEDMSGVRYAVFVKQLPSMANDYYNAYLLYKLLPDCLAIQRREEEMKDTVKKGRPAKLKLTPEQEDKYITTRSHSRLAKELGIKLSELKVYAEENGLDEESRLYWEDVSLERLKEAVESPETDEVSATHINSLIKTLRSYRPKGEVGRPSEKKAYEKGMNAAQKDQEEMLAHVERMRGV